MITAMMIVEGFFTLSSSLMVDMFDCVYRALGFQKHNGKIVTPAH